MGISRTNKFTGRKIENNSDNRTKVYFLWLVQRSPRHQSLQIEEEEESNESTLSPLLLETRSRIFTGDYDNSLPTVVPETAWDLFMLSSPASSLVAALQEGLECKEPPTAGLHGTFHLYHLTAIVARHRNSRSTYLKVYDDKWFIIAKFYRIKIAHQLIHH